MLRVRASSLSELFDCPHRWEAKHVLGLRMPGSAATQLGTAVHNGTAIFDQSCLNGQMIPADDIAGVVVDTLWHPSEEVDWGDSSPKEAEPIALSLYGKYCGQIAPMMEYVAVEEEMQDIELPDIGIKLTGTTDRIYVDQFGEYGIADIKTGKTAVSADGVVKTSGHGAQVAIYELLTEFGTGRRITAPARIIGLTSAKTEKAQRVGIGEIRDARELIIGADGKPGLLEMAAQFLKSGMFYGNPKSSLCSEKFCPRFNTCFFRR